MKHREIGLLTANEFRLFLEMEQEYIVILERDNDTGKWCIFMQGHDPAKSYYIQKQRGGKRWFSHLEDALRTAYNRLENVNNVMIRIDDRYFYLEGTDSKLIEIAKKATR